MYVQCVQYFDLNDQFTQIENIPYKLDLQFFSLQQNDENPAQ